MQSHEVESGGASALGDSYAQSRDLHDEAEQAHERAQRACAYMKVAPQHADELHQQLERKRHLRASVELG
jgi:hypothetical protein